MQLNRKANQFVRPEENGNEDFYFQGNNVHLARIVLAILVIFSHSFPLVEGDERNEPLQTVASHLTIGRVAVDCFFLLSGFLITASWQRSRSLPDFFVRRVARIYPGFIFAGLFSAYLLVPAVAHDHSSRRLGIGEFSWGVFFLQGTPSFGVFDLNPNKALNGSLWTIPYEFCCYLLTMILGFSGLLTRYITLLLVGVITISFVLLYFEPDLIHNRLLGKYLGKPSVWARFAPLYFTGMWGCLNRERIKVTTVGLVIATFSLLVISQESTVWNCCFPIFGGYLLFAMLFRKGISWYRLERFGDFSYGTYLFAFPVQQVIVLKGQDFGLTPVHLFMISTPIVLGFAILSWYLIENPCLRLAKRFLDKSRLTLQSR